MAKKFRVGPLVGVVAETFSVGTVEAPLVDADVGKLVSVGTVGSQVVLGAADAEIFGVLTSIESGTHGGYKIGGVVTKEYVVVDATGLAVGDVVVIDSNPAPGTKGLTKVKKALDAGAVVHKWQVIEPGADGVIRRV